jgi:hypothetical protein
MDGIRLMPEPGVSLLPTLGVSPELGDSPRASKVSYLGPIFLGRAVVREEAVALFLALPVPWRLRCRARKEHLSNLRNFHLNDTADFGGIVE